jgi:hypothetical protein
MAQRGCAACAKLFFAFLGFNALDLWLWPQINDEQSTYSAVVGNSSVVAQYTNDELKEAVADNVDRFWTKLQLDDCFHRGACEWDQYGLMAVSCFVLNICGCVYLHETPRFASVYCPSLTSVTCVFHQFAVRGRYEIPDATMMWAGVAGSVLGVMQHGCVQFMCGSETATLHP